MAQTQSGTPKRSRAGSSSSNGSGSKSRATQSARKSSSNRATAKRSTARKAPSRSGGSAARRSTSNGPVDNVKQAVSSGAQSTKDTLATAGKSTKDTLATASKTAASAVGGAAQKAKGPAMAGGAALAGLAGGVVLATRGGPRRVLGVPVPGTRRPLVKVKRPRRTRVAGKDLLKAAGDVGSAGRQVGQLANEMRLVREQMDSRRRRSPVEVVLEGLTSRRPRD
jgi:hypothetical protein